MKIVLTVLFAALAVLSASAQSVKPPLLFEQNTGRHPDQVRFVSRLGADALFLAQDEFVVVRDGKAVRAELEGAQGKTPVEGEDARPGVVRHIRGDDPSEWHEAPVFGAARYVEPWPGIDVRFHADHGELEYDFLLQPGADPADIALRVSGGEVSLDAGGDLVIGTGGEPVRHLAPVAWQGSGEAKQPVAAAFVVDEGVVRLEVGDYDRTRPLTVDPIIVYTTWLGGSGGEQWSRIDAFGNEAVVVGVTGSLDFPLMGEEAQGDKGSDDIFVSRFTADGSSLVFSTYLGGDGIERNPSVSINGGNAICIAGGTTSWNFPTTGGALQPNMPPANAAAFMVILEPLGGLRYATYFGGTSATTARAVATFAGSVYIAGETSASDLPGTAEGFQPFRAGGVDAYCAAFIGTVTGTVQFVGCTYYGGWHTDMIYGLDAGPDGIAASGMTQSDDLPGAISLPYGGGRDGFVVTFGANMRSLGYATYLGGSSDENWATTDRPTDCSWGPGGYIHVVGDTTSPDFPVTGGAFQGTLNGSRDAYLTVLDPLQQGPGTIVWSTFFGGSNSDAAKAIDVDPRGNSYVAGWYRSADYPQVFAFGPAFVNFTSAMIVVFDAFGRLRFSTAYGVGSDSSDIVSAADGYVLVTGSATTIPTTPGAFQTVRRGTDVWVGRFSLRVATASIYGQGLPGSFGVPSLTVDADPVLGTTVNITIGNSSGAPSVAVLVMSTMPGNTPSPFGGTILVGNFVAATVAIPPGGVTIPLPIPPNTNLCRLSLFLQAAVLDAGAIAGVALTPGLRLDLGI